MKFFVIFVIKSYNVLEIFQTTLLLYKTKVAAIEPDKKSYTIIHIHYIKHSRLSKTCSFVISDTLTTLYRPFGKIKRIFPSFAFLSRNISS